MIQAKNFLYGTLFLVLFKTTLVSAAIQVITDNSTLKNQIESHKLFKEASDLRGLKSEVQSFLIKEGYYNSEAEITQNTLTIKNAFRWDVLFEGNKEFSRHLLKIILSETSFTPSSKTFLSEASYGLERFYRKHGFHFAEIKATRLDVNAPFTKKALFKVTENKKVRLDNVEFLGSFSPFKKKGFLKLLKQYGGAPISQGFFEEEALESALVSLRNDLKNQGYFNSEVKTTNVIFNAKRDSTKVFILINLGLPTTINSLKFNGNSSINSIWLRELLGLSKGDVLNLYRLEEGLNLIEDYYLQRGFLRVQVEKNRILKYASSLKTADVKIKIMEAEQVLVSNIKITGLEKTKPYVVENELVFKPGEILTLEKIKVSNKNLQMLGFFSDIKILPIFNNANQVGHTVEVSLKERKSGAFVAGLGLNTELGLTLKTFLGLSYKNLWGTGRSISSRFELKRNLREINYLENRTFISYLEPDFIKKNIDAKFNLSRNDEIWDLENSTVPFYTLVTFIDSNKFDFILETMLTSRTKLLFSVLSLDLRKESVGAYKNSDSAPLLSPSTPEIREFIGTIGPRLQIDYRNHPFLPTNGFLSNISMEYGSPLLGSKTKFDLNSTSYDIDLEFLRFQGSHSLYKPLKKNLIFAQSFQAGYLHNFTKGFVSNGTSYTPFPKSKAFFLGGTSTIRGFDPSDGDERIPSDTSLQRVIQGNTIGGGLLSIPSSSHYYLSKTEIRFPLSKKSSWWGALFYDGGSVQISSLSLDAWRHSVGLGLRFNTPLGPLVNMELAYKLDRKTALNESTYEFHLSVSSF